MKKTTIAIGAFLTILSGAAHADDYGCTVLLCLANPAGPKAAPYCVPFIVRLFSDLARGRAFPTCDTGNAASVRQGFSYYDYCPEGLSALAPGQYAVQGTGTPTGRYNPPTQYYTGIGEGDGAGVPGPGAGGGMPPKVCVGKRVGSVYVSVPSDDYNSQMALAGVYDQVVPLAAQGSPRIIDVFVDGKFQSRVRW